MKLLIKWWRRSKEGVKSFWIGMLLLIPYEILNAMIVRWMSLALDNYEDPYNYISLVVLACLINIVLAFPMEFHPKHSRNTMFNDLELLFEEKVLNADYNFFNKYSPSKLNSLIEELNRISASSRLLSSAISAFVSIIVTIISISIINPSYIIPIIIVYGIASYTFYKFFKRIVKYDNEGDKIFMKRNEERHAVIDGYNEVRCFCKEKEHQRSMKSLNEKGRELFIEKVRLSSFSGLSLVILDAFVTIGGIILAVFAVRNGSIGASVAMSLIMYVWRLINPMTAIVGCLDELSYNISLIPEFDEMMEYKNSLEDGSIDLVSFNENIKFSHVSFAYNDSDTVIHDLDIDIKKGEKIGICGPSGEGKSTLLKLLLRFYDPQEGGIYIDGIDIRFLKTSSLRRYIGIVNQDTYIFNGTILENIRYADSNATDAEIIDALKKACLYDFVKSLPDGINTYVGPKGMKLSGGQKQRISLARIFLYNPEIILLDEATSALDTECENIIQESMKNFKDKTVIAVAHRLSTIQDSDKIIVIDNHSVAEVGTHDELIFKNGVYASLYRA